MTAKNSGNESLGIPSVDELVRSITQHEEFMAELCGLPETEGIVAKNRTVFDYLIHADDFLADKFAYEYRGEWNTTDKAKALFLAYKVYVQMAGRQKLQREVRFVGELYKSNPSDTSDTFTNIEFRDEKGDVHPFYKYRASAVARRQRAARRQERDESPDDDTVIEPLRRIRAYEGRWGEEWKPLLDRACIFQTGTRRGIC